MRRSWYVGITVVMGMGLVGCVKTQTRIVEVPRVDQELQGGNRGYLQGSGPLAAAPRKTTRQLIMTDVELPIRDEMKPVAAELGPNNRGFIVREGQPPAPAPVVAQPVTPHPEWTPPPPVKSPAVEELPSVEPMTVPAAPAPEPSRTYTVRKGDTLEKIAKTVYGDANRWPRIYKANKGILKSPNRLYPGQVLTIPPLASSEELPHRTRAHRTSGPESLK